MLRFLEAELAAQEATPSPHYSIEFKMYLPDSVGNVASIARISRMNGYLLLKSEYSADPRYELPFHPRQVGNTQLELICHQPP